MTRMAQPEHARHNALAANAGSAASTTISCLICTQRVAVDAMGRHMERKHLDYKRHACQNCDFNTFEWRSMGMHAEELGHRALLNSNRNSYTERLVKRLRKDCMKAARGVALSVSTISSATANSSAAASHPSDPKPHDEQTDVVMGAMKTEPGSRVLTPEPVRESAAEVGRAASKEKDGGQTRGEKVAKKKIITCLFPNCGAKIPFSGSMVLPTKRRHIESTHLTPGIDMMCPVGGCTSTQSSLSCLSAHIFKAHKGVDNLSDEERAVYRETRQRVNAAVKTFLPQCFPDAVASTTAAEEGVVVPQTRRRRSARKNRGAVAMETALVHGDEQQ